MRTEHYLFHVPGVTSESRMKIVDSKGIALSPSVACHWPFYGDDFVVILTLCFWSRCSMWYFVLPSLLFTIYM